MADLTGALQAAAGTAASAGGAADPNFNQTVLLLHGDGTNGAQNQTFLDSSTNNFTITRNGNTTQGTFSPFSVADGEWSNYFDGTGYLTFADSADFAMGAGDFTIQGWFYTTSSARQFFIGQSDGSTDASMSFALELSSGQKFRGFIGNGSVLSIATGATSVVANQWNHFAYVRDGNTCRVYLNGVQDGTDDVTGVTMHDSSDNLAVGRLNGRAIDLFAGYLSNIQIIKGTCLYTGGTSFTPPTAPLSPSATNQKLLTCYSNRFVDANTATTAKTATPTGGVAVQPFSPFAPSAAYSPSVNGGSGYFDGTGDYLSFTPNASLDYGTGELTFSAWIYPTTSTTTSNLTIIDTRPVSGSQDNFYYAFVNSSGKFRFFATAALEALESTTVIAPFQWTHVACARSGTTVRLFVNGVEEDSQTSSSNLNSSLFRIGAKTFSSSTLVPWNGYMSDIRIEGTALYTGNFSVPTAPADPTGSELCLSMQNAGIFDNTGKNNLETVGNAQIDTATKKYGTGSMEFDGTGDWLKVPNSPDLQLGTGDFTIEFWVYLASGDTGSARGLVAKGGASTGWLVSLDSSEKVVFTYTTSTITSSGAITTNAWNHIAVVREGTGSNETKIYIGGTNDGTGTVSTDFNQTEVMYVGANRAAGDPMKGFIDDLRITKGVARYTTGFTPPTAALPDL